MCISKKKNSSINFSNIFQNTFKFFKYKKLLDQRYEEVKTHYREKIFKLIDQEGLGNSRFMILEGLTKLRQIANHPRMVEQGYTGDSGKLEDVT